MQAFDSFAFRRHDLPSGTRLYFQHRPLPFTGCRVHVHAGSRVDPPGKAEIMHVLEHLVGTDIPGVPSRTLTELQRWINRKRFQCMLGQTSLDASCYDGKAANGEKFAESLRFLHTMTMLPTFAEQLDKERDIVRRERDESDTARERAFAQRRLTTVFGNDPARRCESWAEDPELDSITLEDVRQAHARWYHPANTSLIVMGGMDEDELLRYAEQTFVASDRPFTPPPPVAPKTFDFRCHKARHLRMEDGSAPDRVCLAYYWYLPPVEMGRLNVGVRALETAVTDRLREKMRATYDASCEIAGNADFREVALATLVSPDAARPARRAIEEELRRFVDATDWAEERDALTLTHFFDNPDMDVALCRASSQLERSGAIRTNRELIEQLDALSPEQVAEIAREHLTLDKAYVEVVEV